MRGRRGWVVAVGGLGVVVLAVVGGSGSRVLVVVGSSGGCMGSGREICNERLRFNHKLPVYQFFMERNKRDRIVTCINGINDSLVRGVQAFKYLVGYVFRLE